MKKTIVPIVLAVSLVILIAGASVLYSRYGDSFGGGQLIVPSAGDPVTTTTADEITVTVNHTTTVFEGGGTVTVTDRREPTSDDQPIVTTATATENDGIVSVSSTQTNATTATKRPSTVTTTKQPSVTTATASTTKKPTKATTVSTTAKSTTTAATTTTTKPPRTEKKAPDFTAYDENGKAVKLSDYRGKPIVLNFWASWCPPCKAEMPDFQKKYEQIGGEVQFLMVNLTVGSETVKTAKSFIAKNGYTFPILYDRQQSAVYAYDIYSIPSTFFIDSEGYIMAQATGKINAATLQQGIDRIK